MVTAPGLHHTPERFQRPDGTSRFRPRDHTVYTTRSLLDAEARLLDTGRDLTGPAVAAATVASTVGTCLPGRDHTIAADQAVAVEQIATSGRVLDVLVGPAGTGKSTSEPMTGDHHFDQHARSRAAVVSAPPRLLFTRTQDRRSRFASCHRSNHSSQRTPPTAALAGTQTACGRQPPAGGSGATGPEPRPPIPPLT